MAEKEYALQVRLTKAEKDTLTTAANAAGLTMSAWVRDRLRRVARQELQASGIKVAFLESVAAHL